MIHNKLVRDKIPEIIESTGKKVTFRILDEAEYREALEKKLIEEVAEFHESKSLEELADIYEVFVRLSLAYGYSLHDVECATANKYMERGGFNRRVFLEEVTE